MTQLSASVIFVSRTIGDLSRRRAAMLVLVFSAFVGFGMHNTGPGSVIVTPADILGAPGTLGTELTQAFALADERQKLIQRALDIVAYAEEYGISERLSGDIYSAAENAGIDPDLAFRVVRIESDFDETATSPVGAVGLTQVMPATARLYNESITDEMLYNRAINLRIGFSYLREMLEQHEYDVMLALAAYNRGPGTVSRLLLAQGHVPTNAYERVIMRGYTGRGILD
jgi:soluble lytic murein transglycosylase-like protein